VADFPGISLSSGVVGGTGDVGNVGGTVSGFTSNNLLTPGTKQSIQAINQTTGTKKAVTLAKSTAQPISGQPNDLPDSFFPASDDPTFPDTYRDGSDDDTNSEQFNPLTLASNDEEQIATMTLTQPVASSSTNGGVVTSTSLVGATFINAYTRFFLQGVTEAEQEKYQVVETFTGFYTFFYGKRPPIYRYSGLLLSDPNYRWNNDFKYVYENFFRGTSAVEFAAEVIMTYNGRVITGFPLSLTMQQEAANDKGMPFSMDLLVVSHDVILSSDISDLLQQKQIQLAQYRNAVGVQQARLVAGASGPGALLASSATNLQTPAWTIATTNSPLPSPVNGRAVAS